MNDRDTCFLSAAYYFTGDKLLFTSRSFFLYSLLLQPFTPQGLIALVILVHVKSLAKKE